MNENQPVTEATSRRTERVVGVFVALALLLLVAGFAYYLYHTAERKGWLIPKCPYFTFVESGRRAESRRSRHADGVRGWQHHGHHGAAAGSDRSVYVGMEIRSPYYGYIWTDSKVRIAPAGFLGSRGLEITPGVTGSATVQEEGGRVSELWIHDHWVPLAKVRKGVHLVPDEQPSLSDRAQKLVSTVEQALAQHS